MFPYWGETGLAHPLRNKRIVKQNFAVIILGGADQVGGAAVAELLATSDCREVVMVTINRIAPRSRARATSFLVPALRTLRSALLLLPAEFSAKVTSAP